MLKPDPGVVVGKLGLYLFGIDVADTVALLFCACGPCLGHCAPKIAKTVTYLISKLDLVQNHGFPLTAQPIFGLCLPWDP